jgi:hypothetical protein
VTHVSVDTVSKADGVINFYDTIIYLTKHDLRCITVDDLASTVDFLNDVHNRDGVMWLLSHANYNDSKNWVANFLDLTEFSVMNFEKHNGSEKIMADMLFHLAAFLTLNVGHMHKYYDIDTNADSHILIEATERYELAKGFLEDAEKHGNDCSLLHLLKRAFSVDLPAHVFYESVIAIDTLAEAIGEKE